MSQDSATELKEILMSAGPVGTPSLSLQLASSTADGRTVVRCSGPLIAATADLFKTEVIRKVDRSRILVVDLAGLTSIDTAGWEAIESVYGAVRKANSEFLLLEGSASRDGRAGTYQFHKGVEPSDINPGTRKPFGALGRDLIRVCRKPPNLIYGVDEAPPLFLRLVLALQHVFVISVGWIFVVGMVNAIGGTAAQAQGIIRISMIASGLATILQARIRGPLGSGYLCPFSCGPAYLSASILAGKTGGLPLIFGLTTASGVFESLVSRFMNRLRMLFPPEVTGLVVAMVGIELVGLGCPRFFGFHGQGLDIRAMAAAFATLVAMVVPTVWRTSKLRLYPVLLGLMAGYGASLGLGILNPGQFRASLMAPLVSLPGRVPGGGWAIHWTLLPPFLVASASSMLKAVGDLTLCEKINDVDWKRTEMKLVAGGILAGAACTALAGLSGGMGLSTFSSSVGLSMATGASSRCIALPVGVILIALAFFPKLAATFAVIPEPVMGAVLVYVSCFMILGGLQLATSRMLDTRRTFVIGIALIFGLSVEMVPGLYRGVPVLVQPLFASALSLTTVLVVVLNLLLRIGVAHTRTVELSPENRNPETIMRLMEENGAIWGMRKEVALRAADAIHECLINLRQSGIALPVLATLRFDELTLDVALKYQGPAIELPATPPLAKELTSDPAAWNRLSGYLLRQIADRVTVSATNGLCHIRLHFDH